MDTAQLQTPQQQPHESERRAVWSPAAARTRANGSHSTSRLQPFSSVSVLTPDRHDWRAYGLIGRLPLIRCNCPKEGIVEIPKTLPPRSAPRTRAVRRKSRCGATFISLERARSLRLARARRSKSAVVRGTTAVMAASPDVPRPVTDINSAPQATEIRKCRRLLGGTIFWVLTSEGRPRIGATLSLATSHKPWRRRHPSTSPAHCRSGGLY
jgi:hypothetical protein